MQLHNILLLLTFTICGTSVAHSENLPIKPQLFANLPDNCPTPDAFAIAPDGTLTLSCPNFANKQLEGELFSISKNGDVRFLLTVPRLSENKKSNPMGIAYGDDGGLYIADARGINKGRILKLNIENNKLLNTEVIASGLNPNGLRYHQGGIYVTQLKMPRIKSPKMTSGIYRFNKTDRNIRVDNTLNDKQLIFHVQTQNPDKQIGLDGIAFDSNGFLYTTNLGDGIVYQLELNNSGKVINNVHFADVPRQASIDGMAFDKANNLYLAGFASNQIFKITPDKKVMLLAESPDSNGSMGQLDQPADLIVFGEKLVISNFDLMTGKGMKNSQHSKPYTLSFLPLHK